MATYVYKNAHVTVNSVDLSNDVQQLSTSLQLDTVEDTAMGDNARSYIAGLRDGTFDVTFNADDTTGQVSATLWTIYSGASSVTFTVKPNGTTTSTSNPAYSGSCFVSSWNPLDGSVGDLATNTATFQITGDVTRATA